MWSLSDFDLKNLDEYEGYKPGRQGNSYVREQVVVYVNGIQSSPLVSWVYMAIPEPNAQLPSADYMKLIIGGAEKACLPTNYIIYLKSIEYK